MHLNPPPSAETLAQAQILLACFLTPQQKIQLKPSPPIHDTEDSSKESPEDLTNFKSNLLIHLFVCTMTNAILAFRPLFEDNPVTQDILHVSSVQLPQSVQSRIHTLCSTRLHSISAKLINDCQEIASSKVCFPINLI